ncbi:GMC oxidoreductase [Vararia minispora EC-137]|uniref:GMC oxidoreductase n=1 Tax=Vararia minispora EC-137 TaxID=1314806 RepID=A0ACB8QJK6_9AGAM|nr:GMC oxidoreductase [Vararia minispora EC-137]
MAIAIATIDDVSGKTFDYVIVGGGTAGLVLAGRLSEDPDRTVLVLEAGGAHLDDPNITMPASYAKVFGDPEYDWGFTTVPQEHADGVVYGWQRGKGLGGSSAINFYVWNLPPKADIDAWEALGNPGWNWKNFIKYAKKSETFLPPPSAAVEQEGLTYDKVYHGTQGPLGLGYCNMRTGWEQAVTGALQKHGFKQSHDHQAGDTTGTNYTTSTVDPRTNQRAFSQAYLSPRPNLTVLTNAPATQITAFPASNTGAFVASGVRFVVEGKEHWTGAAREVVLSAGAIKSPQILELSGIGSAPHLASLGVEPKVDLPAVGENAQEHMFCGVSWELKEPEKFNTLDPLRDPKRLEAELQKYAQGDGLFTLGIVGIHMAPLAAVSPRASEILATAPAPASASAPGLAEQRVQQHKRVDERSADLEIISFPGFLSYPNPPEEGKKYLTLLAAINHPWSRGTIHAGSRDALAQPVIDPHYFEEGADLQTFIEHVKFVRRLGAEEPLASLLAKELNPGPAIASDAEVAAWLKKHLSTTFHTAGTTAMLPRARGGVVDPSLKVYGTQNVRVVDLGVVPLHIAAHTQAAVFAIAEQAADIIKGTFKA